MKLAEPVAVTVTWLIAVEGVMVEKVAAHLERASNRARWLLLVMSATLVALLAVTQRAEAYCNYMSCPYSGPSACLGDFCFHIGNTHAYYDTGCTTNCCIQGPCYYYDVYPDSGTGCAFCTSGDTSQCGYGAGC